MIKALSTHLFMFEPLSASMIELLANKGFRGIEIWGMEPHFPYRDSAALEAGEGVVGSPAVDLLRAGGQRQVEVEGQPGRGRAGRTHQRP